VSLKPREEPKTGARGRAAIVSVDSVLNIDADVLETDWCEIVVFSAQGKGKSVKRFQLQSLPVGPVEIDLPPPPECDGFTLRFYFHSNAGVDASNIWSRL